VKKLANISIISFAFLLLMNTSSFVFAAQKANATKSKYNASSQPKATFVLVHAAWLGGWSWKQVKEKLQAKGHKVIALDLPGHGKDRSPPKRITMRSYVQRVVSAIDKQKGKVILVGHSFGGIVISQVAERRTHKIQALVYLAAFLLPRGQSFMSATQGVKTSEVLNNLIVKKSQGIVQVKSKAIHHAFGADLPRKVFRLLSKKLSPEPIRPLSHKLDITPAKWGSLPRYYIETLADNAIPNAIQKKMYTGIGVNKVYTLQKSSHLPLFSAPGKVARFIHDIAQREEARESFIQASKRWIQAFNAGKLHYCANVYRSNAVMTVFGVGDFKGRKKIAAFWTSFIRATKAGALKYKNTTIKVLHPRRIHLQSDWSMNVGKGTIGLESWVRNSKGQWKIELDQFRVTKRWR